MSAIDWGTDIRIHCSECKDTKDGIVPTLILGTFHHCPHIEAACIAFNFAEEKRWKRERYYLGLFLFFLGLGLGLTLGAMTSGV